MVKDEAARIREWTYADLQVAAGRLDGYVKVKVDVNSALALARMNPKPSQVVTTVMKAVASYGEITLEQLRMLFGVTARKNLKY